jgi:hypothetical protein
MVNSANTDCLLCGALARGHFVPIAAIHTSEIERPVETASEKQALEYAQSNRRNRPISACGDRQLWGIAFYCHYSPRFATVVCFDIFNHEISKIYIGAYIGHLAY